jgi:hypothetical protein
VAWHTNDALGREDHGCRADPVFSGVAIPTGLFVKLSNHVVDLRRHTGLMRFLPDNLPGPFIPYRLDPAEMACPAVNQSMKIVSHLLVMPAMALRAICRFLVTMVESYGLRVTIRARKVCMRCRLIVVGRYEGRFLACHFLCRGPFPAMAVKTDDLDSLLLTGNDAPVAGHAGFVFLSERRQSSLLLVADPALLMPGQVGVEKPCLFLHRNLRVRLVTAKAFVVPLRRLDIYRSMHSLFQPVENLIVTYQASVCREKVDSLFHHVFRIGVKVPSGHIFVTVPA